MEIQIGLEEGARTESLADGIRKAAGRMLGSGKLESMAKKGKGIVELQAGGWSFTARDMEGNIYVWGEYPYR